MGDFIERMKVEEAELAGRTMKLSGFIGGETFKSLSEAERFLLSEQYFAMCTYHRLLARRISLHSKGPLS